MADKKTINFEHIDSNKEAALLLAPKLNKIAATTKEVHDSLVALIHGSAKPAEIFHATDKDKAAEHIKKMHTKLSDKTALTTAKISEDIRKKIHDDFVKKMEGTTVDVPHVMGGHETYEITKESTEKMKKGLEVEKKETEAEKKKEEEQKKKEEKKESKKTEHTEHPESKNLWGRIKDKWGWVKNHGLESALGLFGAGAGAGAGGYGLYNYWEPIKNTFAWIGENTGVIKASEIMAARAAPDLAPYLSSWGPWGLGTLGLWAIGKAKLAAMRGAGVKDVPERGFVGHVWEGIKTPFDIAKGTVNGVGWSVGKIAEKGTKGLGEVAKGIGSLALTPLTVGKSIVTGVRDEVKETWKNRKGAIFGGAFALGMFSAATGGVPLIGALAGGIGGYMYKKYFAAPNGGGHAPAPAVTGH